MTGVGNKPGQKWTVPLGGGFGKILKLGKLPINTTIQAYDNFETSGFFRRLDTSRAVRTSFAGVTLGQIALQFLINIV
jgi:hypothetical protein